MSRHLTNISWKKIKANLYKVNYNCIDCNNDILILPIIFVFIRASMAEWSNALDLSSSSVRIRGFKSHCLHLII